MVALVPSMICRSGAPSFTAGVDETLKVQLSKLITASQRSNLSRHYPWPPGLGSTKKTVSVPAKLVALLAPANCRAMLAPLAKSTRLYMGMDSSDRRIA